MIRTIVTGVNGRMGATLVRMVGSEADMRVVGGTERKGSEFLGVDVGAAARFKEVGVPVRDDLDRAIAEGRPDVVIDFTAASASLAHARICAEKKVPMVIGSTGFTPETKAEVAEFARRIPVVMSPNMSVGVNLIIKMAGQLARSLGDGFDVEIVEAHHRMKKDAPSGTALRLAEEIAGVLGRKSSTFRTARVGQVGERPAGEIGIQSIRGGDVVGEHTVIFFGEGERVELIHRALNRDQFAKGALRAARWVIAQPSGLYDMQDVLGLRNPPAAPA